MQYLRGLWLRHGAHIPRLELLHAQPLHFRRQTATHRNNRKTEQDLIEREGPPPHLNELVRA